MNPRDAIRVSLFTFSMLTLMLTGCRPHDFPQYPANYREYMYVTNGGSGTVTVLDVVNVRLDRELPVGQNPVAVAASPTRNEVYVVNSGAAGGVGSISVINTENNTVAATIPLHRQPVSIDLDPEGKLAYVANSGSNSISVVDLKSRRETNQIGAGEEPVAARLSADGKTLAVTNRRGNSVSLIDTASLTVRAVFEGCPGASDVVMLPDSSKAFVACSAGHQVMAISLARASQAASSQARSAPASPAVPDQLEAMMDVGHAPVQLALKPDGGEVFVSNLLSDSVSEIYNSTDEVGATYMIGDGPMRGLVSGDNSLLYVANFHSQYVGIYGINDGKRVGSVHVGDGPSALAFSAGGNLLFVVDTRSGDVAVVRTASFSLFTLLPTGRNPNAIVDKAFKLP
ncbi:MAG TPA: beta-propeller fold lactonase family protein [Terracidiphilus sp.]|nr:beta-propeller fold lactonase family protein [Terracidiphilus sp.]